MLNPHSSRGNMNPTRRHSAARVLHETVLRGHRAICYGIDERPSVGVMPREVLITEVLGALDQLKIDPSRIVASKA